MAQILTKNGILSGSIVQPGHVTQSIDAFTGTQAYDITLSGSLVVTGSVILDTIINKNFHGTASYVITSSYASTSSISSYALTTSFADNETIILQLYSPRTDISQSYNYNIGAGNQSTSSADLVGIIYPKGDGIIYRTTVTSVVAGITGSLTSNVRLYVNSTNFSFQTNPLRYLTGSNTITSGDNQQLPVTQGDKIYVLVETGTTGYAEPTKVTHNVNLYIKRTNG
jgi:hypothetical protein